jgi:hypothetical protein
MKTYYFTFGWAQYDALTDNKNLKDQWVEIEACDPFKARKLMFKLFGKRWSMQYVKEEFKPEYFPKGCYKRFCIVDGTGAITGHDAGEIIIDEFK